MNGERARTEAVSLLQDLGLKEYEARSFLALTQVPDATARELSDRSEVPRTRVYEAVRVLEAKGLVEVQHTSPQRFRAVSVDEGTATLRRQYADHIDTLQSRLESLDLETASDDSDRLQVWSLTGAAGIQSRTYDLLENADSEVVLLVVEAGLLTEGLFERVRDAVDRGVNVVVGGKTDAITARLEAELPPAQVFETDLGWLVGPDRGGEVAISRVLLVDHTALLVGSFYPGDGRDESREQAVFANGLENGIVVLVRRLLSSSVLPVTTPAE